MAARAAVTKWMVVKRARHKLGSWRFSGDKPATVVPRKFRVKLEIETFNGAIGLRKHGRPLPVHKPEILVTVRFVTTTRPLICMQRWILKLDYENGSNVINILSKRAFSLVFRWASAWSWLCERIKVIFWTEIAFGGAQKFQFATKMFNNKCYSRCWVLTEWLLARSVSDNNLFIDMKLFDFLYIVHVNGICRCIKVDISLCKFIDNISLMYRYCHIDIFIFLYRCIWCCYIDTFILFYRCIDIVISILLH